MAAGDSIELIETRQKLEINKLEESHASMWSLSRWLLMVDRLSPMAD